MPYQRSDAIPATPHPGTLYVAVGHAGSARSSTVRIWTSKATNDWYAAVRVTAGIQKYSFHQSGNWSHSFLSEEIAEPYTEDGRHIDLWRRPAPVDGGWVRALQVRVPTAGLRPLPGERVADVQFADPAPGSGGWTFIELFEGPTGGSVNVSGAGARILGVMTRPTGLVVAWSYHPDYERSITIEHDTDAPEMSATARVGLHGSIDNTGERFIIETAVK